MLMKAFTMNTIRLILGMGVLLFAGGVVSAEGPSTRPEPPRDFRDRSTRPRGDGLVNRGSPSEDRLEDRPEGRTPGRMEGRPEGRARRMIPPTAEQWQEVVAFLKENSPNRLEAISNDPPPALKAMAWNRYNHLKQLEVEKDTELHDVVLEQIKAEDEVWQALRELGTAPPSDTELVRGKVGKAVRQMLQIHFKERQIRINRLEKALTHARQDLANDQDRLDELTRERVGGIIEELRAIRNKRIPRDGRDGPRGPGGPAGPGRNDDREPPARP